MKKLLIAVLFGVSLVFTSCDSTPIKVKDPNVETTVQIQSLAKIDTCVYKVVEQGDDIFIVNPKTQLVEKKITNESDVVKFLGGLIIGLGLLGIFLAND